MWGEPGLKVQGITPLLAQGLHLGQNSGVVVSDVTPGTPAATAGLKILDVVTDLDGNVTYWNDGATRLFGWNAAEMLGQPIGERLPEPSRSW